ncbi:MAG: ABC transporter ATP-binding protein [bacterium]|nr:ABC transporter ATP-binding protein [bacterium]
MVTPPSAPAVESLRVENLRVETADGTLILDRVSLEVPQGGTIAVVGESGAGKSTLAKAVAGLLPPSVTICGGRFAIKAKRGDPHKGCKKGVFYMPQNASAALNPVYKISHQVNEVSRLSPTGMSELVEALDFSCSAKVLDSYPFQLSAGENQRCLLAIALSMLPELLIMDEPTASLDKKRIKRFIDSLAGFKRQYGFSLLLITHNLAVAALSDYVYILKKGKIVEHGTANEVFTRPRHPYTRAIAHVDTGGISTSLRHSNRSP